MLALSWLAANLETCAGNTKPVAENISCAQHKTLVNLAARASNLLNIEPKRWIDSKEFENRRNVPLIKRLSYSSKRISIKKFTEHFVQNLGHMKEIWPALFYIRNGEADWIKQNLREVPASRDPGYQILIEYIMEAIPDQKLPGGPGPWRCLNPLAKHAEPSPVVDATFWLDGNRYAGRFICSCGMEYTQSVRANGFTTKPRIKRYGEMFRPYLNNAIATGQSAKATAQAAGLSVKAVRACAKQLGLGNPWARKTMSDRQLPGGPGPWPCLNPLARHAEPFPVVNATYKHNGSYCTGRFRCYCGMEYTLSVGRNGIEAKPRISVYGETFRPHLIDAITMGKTLRETAEIVGLSVKSVRTCVKQLGLNDLWTAGRS